MSAATKTPYWLTEDEKPSRDEYAYTELAAGFRDLYDQATVSVTGSSNAEYHGAWLRMEGTFHVPEDAEIVEYSPAFMLGDKRMPPTLLCEGNIAANLDREKLLRLRNAIDLVLTDMDWRDGTEPLA